MFNIATIALAALALSDGTPVEFVKVTSKGNIQVRVPDTNPIGAEDPLRIFRPDGTHYKDALDVTLVDTGGQTSAAPATAAGANDNTAYSVGGSTFDSLDDAKAEAIDIFRATGETVAITETVTRVVGTVGFTALAA